MFTDIFLFVSVEELKEYKDVLQLNLLFDGINIANCVTPGVLPIKSFTHCVLYTSFTT